MAAKETIKFYYDFKSPFTYLAFAPALALEASHRVALRFIPHELDVHTAYGGTLEARSRDNWRKVRYLYADARRFANDRGLTVRGPQKIFDSRLALLSGLYATRTGRFREYASHVFARFFKRELNLEDLDELLAALNATGIDAGGFRAYAADQGPRDYADAVAEGERDAVFGVPMLIVAGEPFWGNDRIEWVIRKLDAMGLRRQPAGAASGS